MRDVEKVDMAGKLEIENAALYLYIAELNRQHGEVLCKMNERLSSQDRTIEKQREKIADLRAEAFEWYEKERKLYEQYIKETAVPVIREEGKGCADSYSYGLYAIRELVNQPVPIVSSEMAEKYQLILAQIPGTEFSRFVGNTLNNPAKEE